MTLEQSIAAALPAGFERMTVAPSPKHGWQVSIKWEAYGGWSCHSGRDLLALITEAFAQTPVRPAKTPDANIFD